MITNAEKAMRKDKPRIISRMEKLQELEREIAHRERCYHLWVKNEYMTFQDATHQMAVIKAIAADYRRAMGMPPSKPMQLDPDDVD